MKQQPTGIPFSQTTGIVCESCANDTFKEVFYLRAVSRFLTGSPQDAVYPMPAFACAKCGHVNDQFNPTKGPIDAGE